MKYLLLVALMLAPMPARASCLAPTLAEKMLCAPDVRRRCAETVKPPIAEMAVLTCLQANRARLSRGCDALLKACGQ